MSEVKFAVGESYAPKLDKILTKAFAEWWQGLSKEEILMYLYQQPDMTADDLRKIIATSEITLELGTSFITSAMEANANFHVDNN